MVTLIIQDQPGLLFTCDFADWPKSDEEQRHWQDVVNQIVHYAFETRPVTLVTLTPMSWSVGHWLPNPCYMVTSKGPILVNNLEQASDTLLAEIVESEDFQRALLWIVAKDPIIASNSRADEEHLQSLVAQLDISAEQPTTHNTEVLLFLADARSVYWLYPSKHTHMLYGIIAALVAPYGWKITDTAP